jgi:hypothetical protein
VTDNDVSHDRYSASFTKSEAERTAADDTRLLGIHSPHPAKAHLRVPYPRREAMRHLQWPVLSRMSSEVP